MSLPCSPQTCQHRVSKLVSSLLFGFALSTCAMSVSAALSVEPMSWWTGMQQTQLQLLITGDNIRDTQVKLIKAQGVTLSSINKTDSNDHLFVNLDLSQATPQQLTLGLFKDDQLLEQFDYALQARKKGSRDRQGFSNKDVIYLITPDRFANGNPDNDNHPDMLEQANRGFDGGRHGGDIMGIRKALPYLHDLGVTQLWINPLLENNQQKYSYHGYSTTNFYKIDPRFGSNQEYQALVEEAQTFGIGIIQDVVVNHMGSGHQWITSMPSSTWINDQSRWLKDPTDVSYSSHRRTTVQDPYAVSADISDFSDGWFDVTMPDLNQRDPHMATYLIQNSIWWVEYAGLSGIREDTYSYADKHFLSNWSKAIMNEYPHFNIVGEEWTANPVTVSYWQTGKQNTDGYQSFVPSMMDFPVYEALISSLTDKEQWESGFIKLYQMLANDLVYSNPSNLVLFEGNHDTNRIYSLMNNDIELYKIAMAYVLTSNRIPQIFYGSEILMQSPTGERNDGAVRADFPGGWPQDSVNVFSHQGLNADQKQALNFMRTLLNYRKTSQAIQQGDLHHFVPKDGIYVQSRHFGDETLLIVYNKNEQAVELDLSRFTEVFNGNTQGIDIINKQAQALNQPLKLAQKGVTILALSH
ncbi:glycoside hydrolase family 13 protein [Shewanella polaris]|uniref:Alpha-amylase n=1 Tax=Shewanella polaris TaxID=2588449 RepID=A0A4Y5YES9_9GAMM|nr:glycoside hydrolase family 13 protein [Shewanella polaris]QDE31059.1 alpha-amylase [Shewanella polaris]